MNPPTRPVPADWLALRRPADDAARAASAPLLARLADHLPAGPLHVIDVGAGTGANQAWLAPRLPTPQRWTLLDHDPALLDDPGHGPGRRVLAGVEDLPDVLAETPEPRLVTCAALLDLLTGDHLAGLAAALADAAAPALLALTVTGGVRVHPPADADAAIAAAFDAHQRRSGHAGPDAAALMAAAARRHGATVLTAATPWRLDRTVPELRERYLRERADVAAEHDPHLAPAAASWARSHLADPGLVVEVDHVDLLILPGPS